MKLYDRNVGYSLFGVSTLLEHDKYLELLSLTGRNKKHVFFLFGTGRTNVSIVGRIFCRNY